MPYILGIGALVIFLLGGGLLLQTRHAEALAGEVASERLKTEAAQSLIKAQADQDALNEKVVAAVTKAINERAAGNDIAKQEIIYVKDTGVCDGDALRRTDKRVRELVALSAGAQAGGKPGAKATVPAAAKPAAVPVR